MLMIQTPTCPDQFSEKSEPSVIKLWDENPKTLQTSENA